MKATLPRPYTFDDTAKWIIGGLLTSIVGLLIFIKDLAVKLFSLKDNEIDKRLRALELGHSELMRNQTDLLNKIKEVNHKIDNQDVAESGAFKMILEEIKQLKK